METKQSAIAPKLTLSAKQMQFANCIAILIMKLKDLGYDGCTFGESFDDDGIGHMKNSCHYVRLAQDLNLFKGGKYLPNTEDYSKAGQYWKQLHPLARWGGDFTKKDGNHFSFEHEGRM